MPFYNRKDGSACVFCLWPLVLARVRCVCVCVCVCLVFRLLWLPVLGSLFLSVMCVCVCAWGLQKSKAGPLPEVLGIWANLVGGVCFQSALKAHPPNQICSNTKGFWVLELGGPQHLENLL